MVDVQRDEPSPCVQLQIHLPGQAEREPGRLQEAQHVRAVAAGERSVLCRRQRVVVKERRDLLGVALLLRRLHLHLRLQDVLCLEVGADGVDKRVDDGGVGGVDEEVEEEEAALRVRRRRGDLDDKPLVLAPVEEDRRVERVVRDGDDVFVLRPLLGDPEDDVALVACLADLAELGELEDVVADDAEEVGERLLRGEVEVGEDEVGAGR